MLTHQVGPVCPLPAKHCNLTSNMCHGSLPCRCLPTFYVTALAQRHLSQVPDWSMKGSPKLEGERSPLVTLQSQTTCSLGCSLHGPIRPPFWGLGQRDDHPILGLLPHENTVHWLRPSGKSHDSTWSLYTRARARRHWPCGSHHLGLALATKC